MIVTNVSEVKNPVVRGILACIRFRTYVTKRVLRHHAPNGEGSVGSKHLTDTQGLRRPHRTDRTLHRSDRTLYRWASLPAAPLDVWNSGMDHSAKFQPNFSQIIELSLNGTSLSRACSPTLTILVSRARARCPPPPGLIVGAPMNRVSVLG